MEGERRLGVLEEGEVGGEVTFVGYLEEVVRRELFYLAAGVLPCGGDILIEYLLCHSECVVFSILCHDCHLSEQLLLVLMERGR